MLAAQNLTWSYVPVLPHVTYALAHDRGGQFWILMHCRSCGDQSRKACVDPARTPHWVGVYANLHEHRP